MASGFNFREFAARHGFGEKAVARALKEIVVEGAGRPRQEPDLTQTHHEEIEPEDEMQKRVEKPQARKDVLGALYREGILKYAKQPAGTKYVVFRAGERHYLGTGSYDYFKIKAGHAADALAFYSQFYQRKGKRPPPKPRTGLFDFNAFAGTHGHAPEDVSQVLENVAKGTRTSPNVDSRSQEILGQLHRAGVLKRRENPYRPGRYGAEYEHYTNFTINSGHSRATQWRPAQGRRRQLRKAA